jgi:hypothetical protein
LLKRGGKVYAKEFLSALDFPPPNLVPVKLAR